MFESRMYCVKNMNKRKTVLVLGYVVMIVLGILAVYYIVSFNIVPRNEAIKKEFEVDNQTAQVIFHFKSTGGVFSTGKTIHVDGILYYPTKTNSNERFSLDLPNTLTPTEYDLLSNDNLWRTHENGSILVMPADVLTEVPHYFSGLPANLSVNFDTVWTQEGFQDGYLEIHDSTNAKNSKRILLDKIIDIQSADVSQNLNTNNMILGLTLYMIVLSFVTILSSIEKTRIENRHGTTN